MSIVRDNQEATRFGEGPLEVLLTDDRPLFEAQKVKNMLRCVARINVSQCRDLRGYFDTAKPLRIALWSYSRLARAGSMLSINDG